MASSFALCFEKQRASPPGFAIQGNWTIRPLPVMDFYSGAYISINKQKNLRQSAACDVLAFS